MLSSLSDAKLKKMTNKELRDMARFLEQKNDAKDKEMQQVTELLREFTGEVWEKNPADNPSGDSMFEVQMKSLLQQKMSFLYWKMSMALRGKYCIH